MSSNPALTLTLAVDLSSVNLCLMILSVSHPSQLLLFPDFFNFFLRNA